MGRVKDFLEDDMTNISGYSDLYKSNKTFAEILASEVDFDTILSNTSYTRIPYNVKGTKTFGYGMGMFTSTTKRITTKTNSGSNNVCVVFGTFRNLYDKDSAIKNNQNQWVSFDSICGKIYDEKDSSGYYHINDTLQIMSPNYRDDNDWEIVDFNYKKMRMLVTANCLDLETNQTYTKDYNIAKSENDIIISVYCDFYYENNQGTSRSQLNRRTVVPMLITNDNGTTFRVRPDYQDTIGETFQFNTKQIIPSVLLNASGSHSFEIPTAFCCLSKTFSDDLISPSNYCNYLNCYYPTFPCYNYNSGGDVCDWNWKGMNDSKYNLGLPSSLENPSGISINSNYGDWNRNTSTRGIFYAPYSEIDIIINSFGIMWSGDVEIVEHNMIDTMGFTVGLIGEDGYNGETYSDSDIPLYVPYWDSEDIVEDSNFKYNPKGYATYDDNTELVDGQAPIGVYSNFYACNIVDLVELRNAIYNPYLRNNETVDEIIDMMGGYSQIYESIVSLRQYPFNLHGRKGVLNNQTTVSVGMLGDELGKELVGLPQCYPITPNFDGIIDCGNVTITRDFNNYLDYSPYTNYQIYLPYIGTFSLDSYKYVGKTINVKYIIDITTGGCIACLFCNGTIYDTYNGIVGVDVTMSSIDDSNKHIALQYKEQHKLSNGVSFLTGIVTNPTPIGAINSISNTIQNIKNDNNNVKFQKNDILSKPSSTPCTQNFMPNYVYIIKTQPKMSKGLVLDSIAKSVGFKLQEQKLLSELSGLTICSNVRINIPCSLECYSDIKSKMESGVIL